MFSKIYLVHSSNGCISPSVIKFLLPTQQWFVFGDGYKNFVCIIFELLLIIQRKLQSWSCPRLSAKSLVCQDQFSVLVLVLYKTDQSTHLSKTTTWSLITVVKFEFVYLLSLISFLHNANLFPQILKLLLTVQ